MIEAVLEAIEEFFLGGEHAEDASGGLELEDILKGHDASALVDKSMEMGKTFEGAFGLAFEHEGVWFQLDDFMGHILDQAHALDFEFED